MMRALIERLLHLPPAPEPPPGDEASARVFRAAPKYFKYRVVIWCIVTAFFLLIVLGQLIGTIAIFVETSHRRSSSAPGLVFAAFALVTFGIIVVTRLISLFVLRLDYERRWYVVTDRSLRIREGIWIVREMTITFANIQNLAVTQGPIQRALGLFDLRVDTAGGGGGGPHGGEGGGPGRNLHAACFRGIDNAAEVKELIQQRLRALKDSGLGDHEERGAAAPDVSGDFLAALREVREEARGLREAVGAN
jgi:uncharacterized membrane protein YdbT with pleckstrin-like domain